MQNYALPRLAPDIVAPYDPIYAIEHNMSAAAAYGLRKLTWFSTKAIRVRRSSDDAETDIGFVNGIDLDVASLKSFVGGDSGYVTTWYDQSGNGNHATQSTADNQPRIVNSGVVDVAPFFTRTSSQHLAAAYNAMLAPTSGITISMIAKATWSSVATAMSFVSKKEGGGYSITLADGGSANNVASIIRRNNNYGFAEYARASISVGAHVISTTYDGRYSKLNIDGVNVDTDDAGGNYPIQYANNNSLTIGGDAGAGAVATSDFLDGYVYEVIIFNTALAEAQRTKLERNQNAYYKVY